MAGARFASGVLAGGRDGAAGCWGQGWGWAEGATCLDAPRVEVVVEREGGGGHADAWVRAELAQPVVGAVRPVVRVRVRVRV